jgi:hypothetical protein
MFGNRVLRRIFGPNREEVVGDWRRLHNDKLHNLYASPNIIRVIKSRRMRWLGHVAVMVKVRVSLGLTKYHTMKAYSGSRGIAPCIL